MEWCLEAISCDVVVDEGFANAWAAELVESVDVVGGAALACGGGVGVVDGKKELAFEADGEVWIAETITGVAAAHVDEGVGHM